MSFLFLPIYSILLLCYLFSFWSFTFFPEHTFIKKPQTHPPPQLGVKFKHQTHLSLLALLFLLTNWAPVLQTSLHSEAAKPTLWNHDEKHTLCSSKQTVSLLFYFSTLQLWQIGGEENCSMSMFSFPVAVLWWSSQIHSSHQHCQLFSPALFLPTL